MLPQSHTRTPLYRSIRTISLSMVSQVREVLVVYGRDVFFFVVADGICGVQLADTLFYLHMFPFYVFVDAYISYNA